MRDRPPSLATQQTALPIPLTGTGPAGAPELTGRPKQQSDNTHLPPWDAVKAYAHLYLKHCNYQPLPLFSESLMNSLPSRDPELLLAILALASRFETINYAVHNAPLPDTFEVYATPAKEMVMRRVAHGPVELSTIQTLCLLSLAEFNSRCFPRY